MHLPYCVPATNSIRKLQSIFSFLCDVGNVSIEVLNLSVLDFVVHDILYNVLLTLIAEHNMLY